MKSKKRITVPIFLHFEADAEEVQIETNGIPETMILELLNKITKGLATKICEDANVTDDKLPSYITHQLKIDRIKIKNMLR